jgi:hypothetical protein
VWVRVVGFAGVKTFLMNGNIKRTNHNSPLGHSTGKEFVPYPFKRERGVIKKRVELFVPY